MVAHHWRYLFRHNIVLLQQRLLFNSSLISSHVRTSTLLKGSLLLDSLAFACRRGDQFLSLVAFLALFLSSGCHAAVADV